MAEKKPTRIVIVSEQAIFLRGLQSLVISQGGLQLIGEARSSAEALQLCRLSSPDMMLLDLNHKPGNWHETIDGLHRLWPELKIALLVEPQDETWVEEEFPGFQLYSISRNVSDSEFAAALQEIIQAAGQRPAEQGQVRFEHVPEEELEEIAELGQPSVNLRNEGLLSRELVMAGKIQADILPEVSPSLPGWDIAARLAPAHETSGDFYDFIPLSDRKLGIVVADVTDKGMGAALFMALSSTLMRTYAVRYPTLPAIALSAVSERILSDTRGGMFVTSFYGVLEPHTGRLIFANAGHPPGLQISVRRGKESIDHLRPTGMALGVSEEARWRQKETRLAPGDVLVLYTDGITEASAPDGTFFEEDRMVETLLRKINGTAQQILDGLLEEVQRFVGHAPRQDDIAMIVIKRKP